MTQLTLRETAFDIRPDAAAFAERDATREANLGARIDFALVTTFAGIEALEADWNTLHAAAGLPAHVFQGFNWCWHWCRHYLGDGKTGTRLAVVTGRIEGRLVLVLPLVTQRTAGLTELTWLGAPVSQYGDALATPEAASPAALEAAWAFVVAETRADVANLRRVRADSVIAPLMERLQAPVTATEEAPFCNVTGDTSFEGWEQRRMPKARKNRRRQARRLADMGEVAFRSDSGTVEAGKLAAAAVRLKRTTLGAKGAITLALADERFEAFFADAAAGLGRPAGVTVLSINSAGTPAALKIIIDDRRARFLHVAVFEPRFERCGVGGLLLEQLVTETIKAGCQTLDLLPPRHEYKMEFGDGVVLVHDYALALSTAGWVYARGYLALRRRLKAVVEGLPLPVRQVLAKIAG